MKDLRVTSGLEIYVVLAPFDLQQGLFDFGLQFFPGIGALDLYDCGTLVPIILHDESKKPSPASLLEVTGYKSIKMPSRKE